MYRDRMIAPVHERAYTTQAPSFRLGRIDTKRCNSYTADHRRQIVMASANSIDRFTPDCGNEFARVRFLIQLVRCSTRSRSGKSGGYTTNLGAGPTSVIGPISTLTGLSGSGRRRVEGPALAMIET